MKVSRFEDEEDISLLDPIQRELSLIGFREGDFANGWKVKPMDRGTTLIDKTLDFCKVAYVSESDRQARRQMVVTKEESEYAFVSSEAVRYRSEGTAQSARAELQRAIEECRTKRGFTNVSGSFITHEFQVIPKEIEDSISARKQIVVSAKIVNANSIVNLVGFYQYRGTNYVGLYIVKASSTPFTLSEIKRWKAVADELWRRLSL